MAASTQAQDDEESDEIAAFAPSIASLLGGGPPPGLPHTINVPGGPPGAPSPDQPSPLLGAGGGTEDQPLQILTRMITDAKRYIDVEPDAEDRATMGGLLRTLLQYQAKDQRDRDAALGGGPATRVLRKSVVG